MPAEYVAPVASEPEHQHLIDSPDLGEVVVDAETAAGPGGRAGRRDHRPTTQGRAPLLIGVLKGAFMFMTDLARAIALPLEIDFMAVSSYGNATRTSGVVRIVKDLDIDLTGRDVIIVEDIVDSGLTLSYLRETLAGRGARPASRCAPCSCARASRRPTRTSGTSGSGSRRSSWSATGSTSPRSTATCPYVCVFEGEA